MPVVDTTTTTLGSNLGTRAIETLPTARNYSSVVQITPGVSSDAHPDNNRQDSITVYGSTGAENVYYIDGVNTTGAEYGFQGKELNFEFIQAVDVKTGGYEAEHGRSTGGIINVITKSGGNQFHGDVFAYHDGDSLQSDSELVVSTCGTRLGFTREDFGLGIGGYIVKDRLWFFAAYDRVKNTRDTSLPEPQAGLVAESKDDRDLAAGKLTYRLSDSQSLIGSFFQDPRDDTGAINDAAALAERRSAHLRGRSQLRRPGLLAALRRRPSGSLAAHRPGGHAPGGELGRTGERGRRRHTVPLGGREFLPDRRLRPDPGRRTSSATSPAARSPAT